MELTCWSRTFGTVQCRVVVECAPDNRRHRLSVLRSLFPCYFTTLYNMSSDAAVKLFDRSTVSIVTPLYYLAFLICFMQP